MKHLVLLALLICLLIACNQTMQAQDRGKHPYASDKPLNEPTIFAPDVITTGDFESHPAFMPDGKTVYFLRSTPNFNLWTIVVSHFENSKWSTPEIAPFSGQYSDADPFITSDGSKLYFISNRPVPGKQSTDLDIWLTEKTATGWSEPKNVGVPVNSPGNEWYPTIAANGTIYFGSDREGGKGRTDLYRSRLVDGKYTEAENLGDAINTQFNEFEPLIAPDESYLIFMAGGRPDGRGGFDLYISYNQNGSWTKPANLGDQINSSGNEYSPTISRDGKYFFWTSTRGFADRRLDKRLSYAELMSKLHGPRNGLGDIYQIDLSELKIGN
jgi:hypothetical protein